jgi:hypothetical protein
MSTQAPLSPTQIHALRVAARNDRWWINGRGGINAARALERRGLATIHWDYASPYPQRYLTLTEKGRAVVDSWAAS